MFGKVVDVILLILNTIHIRTNIRDKRKVVFLIVQGFSYLGLHLLLRKNRANNCRFDISNNITNDSFPDFGIKRIKKETRFMFSTITPSMSYLEKFYLK